jgi:hypothetical protein
MGAFSQHSDGSKLMGKVQGLREIYHDDQMVVALNDRHLVEGSLAGLRVGIQDFEPHEFLGLGLLTLDLASMTQAVEGLMASDPQIGPGLTQYRNSLAARPGQLPITSLDLLLKALRMSYHNQYPYWDGPQIGKNRGIDTLSGAPEIGPGGVGDPLVSQEPLPPRSPQPSEGPPRTEGMGVLVGQIDGPVYPHPWLGGGYLAAPADVVPTGDGYQVNQGHAASVASCILNVAPAAQIHLRRVLGEDGKGDVWNAAKQMVELADLGCDVVNMSVGQCFTDDGNPPLVLETAVELLGSRSVIIAAAGNHGNIDQYPCLALPGLTQDSVYYPAGCKGAIAVGALDQDEKVAPFTPQNAPYIRLMASGTGVTVAYLNGEVTIQHHCQNMVNTSPFPGWATVSGTSYSAAIVTGEIAKRTIPGQKTARDALDELLAASPSITVPNPQGGIIRPN